MSRYIIAGSVLALASLLALAAEKPSALDVTGMPAGEGFYYKGTSGWAKLDRIFGTQTKLSRFHRSLLTLGVARSYMVLVYPESEAPLQISDLQPTFYAHAGGESGRTVRIVQLQKTKKDRELPYTSGTLTTKFGIRDEDIREVVITRISGDVIAITPKAPLAPGEYLISPTGVIGAGEFDFSIAGR